MMMENQFSRRAASRALRLLCRVPCAAHAVLQCRALRIDAGVMGILSMMDVPYHSINIFGGCGIQV